MNSRPRDRSKTRTPRLEEGGWNRFRSLVAAFMTIVSLMGSFGSGRQILAQGDSAQSGSEGSEESSDGTFARTLSLTPDREIEIRLRSAHSAFQIGNSAEGVRVLAELLALPEPNLIETRSTYRDVRDEVARILRSGSQDLRDQFRRETEVRANAELTVAREEGNPTALREIVTRYPMTPTAREAVQLLAQQLFDHGRFDAVKQTAYRWINGAPDPAAEATLCESLVQLWQQATLATEGPTAANNIAARFSVLPTESGFRVQPAPDRFAPPPAETPAVAANWQLESPLPEATSLLLRDIVQLLRRNGVQPQLTSRPLVSGDRVLWRSPTEMICVRASDGTVQWRTPMTDSVIEDVESWKARPDENLGQRVKSQLGHRLLRDSIHGQLSCDAERVYCIEQAPDWLPPPKNGQGGADDLEFKAPIPARTIVARSLETGKLVWKSHEIWDAGHQGLYIFGPPSVQGSWLYVLIQQKEQLLLLRMDARTGKLDGASVLGECTSPMLDRRRLTQAAPIVWNGELAICATGAGAIVAFDVYLGQMSWAFRHPRHDNAPPAQFFMQLPSGYRGWQWFHDWRETQLLRSGSRLVYATPESRQIRCLSVESGDLLWEVPTDGSTLIVAVDAERIVVQADHRLRSYRLTDGSIEVEHHSSKPITSAIWDGTNCHLVLRDGQKQVWNPSTNQVSSIRKTVPWGQLIAPAGTLRPIQGDSVSLLRNMVASGPNLITVTAQGLSSGVARSAPGLAELLPELDWEKSTPQSQVQKLIEWTAAAPESERPQRLSMALAEIAWGMESAPTWNESTGRLCGEWPLAVEDQMELNWRFLQRSLRDGRAEDSLDHLLSLLRQNPSKWEIEVDATGPDSLAERPRTVRLDAAVRGTLQRLWNGSNEQQRAVILGKSRQWAAQPETIAGHWAAALQPLGFLNTPEAAPEPVTSLSQLAATQLGLIQKSARLDRTQATTALLQLAEFQLQRGDRQHAAALLSRLQKQLADVRLPEPASVASLLKTLTGSVPASPANWPNRRPVITTTQRSKEVDNLVPVAVRADRGSAFDRIRVLCPSLPQKHVEFSIDRKLSWETGLPVSHRNLLGEHSLRRGWAFGQFVVLQLGSEVYCISSQKAQGDGKPTKTKDQFLWPKYVKPNDAQDPQKFVDTLGNEDNRLFSSEYRAVPQFVGFIQPQSELFDAHGRRRTWVGPVTAGITCFLQQGMLVCLETSTGQELWRRYDMPGNVRCHGDDEVIGIVHDESRQVDLLSPLDGQTLRTVRLEPAGELLYHWGRHLLIASGQPRTGMLLTSRGAVATKPAAAPATPEDKNSLDTPAGGTAKETPGKPVSTTVAVPMQPLQLSLVDLDGMKTVWSRTYPVGSAAFEVDEEWLGVLHATEKNEGETNELEKKEPAKIELIDRRTGELVSETPVTLPAGLIAVAAAVSDEMIYVSLSSAPTATQLSTGFRPGWRWPLTNGPIYALDRQTGKQIWTRVIENRGLPLNQPRGIPLLLFADTWNAALPSPKRAAANDAEQRTGSRFLVLDSRTGETLHEARISETTPRYTFEKDLAAGWIDLSLDREKVRFDYAPKSE